MAGSVCFHKANTFIDNKSIPIVGDVSAEEAISSLPTTTTIIAEAGDIATVWYDSAVIVKRFPSGGSVPSTGVRIPAGFVERFAVATGDVVRLEAG